MDESSAKLAEAITQRRPATAMASQTSRPPAAWAAEIEAG